MVMRGCGALILDLRKQCETNDVLMLYCTDSLTINLNSQGSKMKLRDKLVFFEFIEEGDTVAQVSH
jgi:hypothetical protein